MFSTPWVAGSNPAGIATQTHDKSPINKGFLQSRRDDARASRGERKGIEADKCGPKRTKIPGLIPGLVSLCEIFGRTRQVLLALWPPIAIMPAADPLPPPPRRRGLLDTVATVAIVLLALLVLGRCSDFSGLFTIP